MTDGERDQNYLLAYDGVDDIAKMALPFIVAGGTRFQNERWQKVSDAAAKVTKSMHEDLYPGLAKEKETYASATERVNNALGLAKSAEKYDAANTAIETFKQAMQTFLKAASDQMANDLMTSKETPEQLRAKALKLTEADPNALQSLHALPGGPELLDKLVKDIGKKAKTADEKNFIKAAITGRYGTRLSMSAETGMGAAEDFSEKNLPLLYKVLDKVPQSHVKGCVNDIKCHTFKDTYLGGDYAEKTVRIGKDIEGASFKETTLHEVGHAVDESKGVMKDGGPQAYGDWKPSSPTEVADVLFKEYGKDFTGQDSAAVKAYLRAVLLTNDPPDAEGKLKPILDGHKAVQICKNLGEDNKLWDQGDSGAKENKIGERVYQESYKGQWWSYEYAIRKTSFVRNYGFRAPAEWFAEAYADFYLGKLSKKHPLYKWLADDKAKATGKTKKT